LLSAQRVTSSSSSSGGGFGVKSRHERPIHALLHHFYQYLTACHQHAYSTRLTGVFAARRITSKRGIITAVSGIITNLAGH